MSEPIPGADPDEPTTEVTVDLDAPGDAGDRGTVDRAAVVDALAAELAAAEGRGLAERAVLLERVHAAIVDELAALDER